MPFNHAISNCLKNSKISSFIGHLHCFSVQVLETWLKIVNLTFFFSPYHHEMTSKFEAKEDDA